MPVGRQHPRDVALDVVPTEVGGRGPHVEGAVLGVRGELEERELLADLRLRERPAEAQPGREDLREAAEVHDPAGGVQALDRRQPLPLVPQFAVGGVLEDDDVELLRQLDQPPAPSQAHRAARRVLVVGHGVDELDPIGRAQHLFESVGVHALVVHRHRPVVGLTRVEGDQRPEEGGPLRDDDVAGIHEELGGEVQTLLPTLGDEDVVRRARHPVRTQACGDECAQLGQPFGCRVLQG